MESAIPLSSDRTSHTTPIAIPLVNRLLERGNSLMRVGGYAKAQEIFTQLLSFGDVPASIRESVHYQLAEIAQTLQLPRKARKHLLAALAIHPKNGETHYRLAKIIEADSEADPERAYYHYRKATQLEPQNAAMWISLAQFAGRMGKRKTPPSALLKAQEIGSDSLSILEQVIHGLLSIGLKGLASRCLNAARFRFHGNRAYNAIWNRFRFTMIARSQSQERQFATLEEVEARILPMLKLVVSTEESDTPKSDSESNILRHDRFSGRHTHLITLEHCRPGPNRAN